MLEVEVVSTLGVDDGLDSRSLGIINMSPIATGELAQDPGVQRLGKQLAAWVSNARSYGSKTAGTMFDRQTYLPSNNPYELMRSARTAVEDDDIVSNALDITEGIAFKGVLHWDSSVPEDADVFNQLSAELELDAKLRVMWRETFTFDQAVVAKLWDWREYNVRGVTAKGNKRKMKKRLWTPVRLVFLNNLQVVPIGYGPLREDRLAWQATEYEVGDYTRAVGGQVVDPLMTAFFTGLYEPQHQYELNQLALWRVQKSRLLAMNPQWVFRHAPLRPDYSPFPKLSLKSLFADLDLKRQLMMSDRSALVGSANYILLIRKGTDQKPAMPEELENLKANYQFLAKLPVIVSDHRLTIDIIAPKQDFVLKKESYELLDERILQRMLRGFAVPGRVPAAADASFYDVIAASIESSRHMIKRTIERELAQAVVNHPRNAGQFSSTPSLAFTPGGAKVGTNQAALSALLALRTQREISRETILQVLGLDQDVEAQRLEYEADTYDAIFKTQIPFAAPAAGGPGATPDAPPADSGSGDAPADPASTPNGTPESPQASGRRGGRPAGGGSPTASPKNMAKPKTSSGNSTKEAK